MIASNALSAVDSYIAAVQNGDIVVCELVRMAVDRHVSDLKKQRTEEFPYYFDATHAAIAIDFFKDALVHTIGHFEDDPFELAPWQAFGVANIHGWKRCSNRARRFRRVYWSTARKNGKSSWGAGEALLLAMMDHNPETGKPEAVANVVLCATKKEQAGIIYKEAWRMRRKSKWIAEGSTDINHQIQFAHNSGCIFTVGSDKPYDGLNPSATIKDEVHAWRERTHRDFYNTITTGGATRLQPIDITVTTAGDTESSIWWSEYNHARGVLRGIYKDETTFALCFEIDEKDDPLDEANWIKANPNLGVSVGLDYLREQAAKVHDKLSTNVFTRYHGNRSVASVDQAISLDQWDMCQGSFSDWSEADCIGGGVDLGGRDDLASFGLCARFDTGKTAKADPDSEPTPIYRYELLTKTYIAADTDRDCSKAPIADWIYTDKIMQREHPIHQLQADLVEMCHELNVTQVAFDPAQALHFAEEMELQGVLAAKMQQNMTYFTEPIRELRSAIRHGRFTHDGDPVLRWCVCNAVAKQDGGERVMFDKSTSAGKIDAIVAGTMAFWSAMIAPARAQGNLFVM